MVGIQCCHPCFQSSRGKVVFLGLVEGSLGWDVCWAILAFVLYALKFMRWVYGDIYLGDDQMGSKLFSEIFP